MQPLRYLGIATAAAVIVFGAGVAFGAPGGAGSVPTAGREGPAGAAARMPDGRIATPPAVKYLPASASCPVPAYGPQFYAPGYRGYAKTVALTFDDGPGKTTGRILRILRRFRAPATFFNIGQNMAARPALLRKEKRYGFVLGNHTWSHPDLTTLTRRQQAAQIDEATAEQRSITGTTPCVFRPPYGNYNATTLSVARDHRLAVWLWSVDPEDWKADGSASAYWVHRIIRLAETEGIQLQHPVIIMHNQPAGNPATALALPAIIRFFRHHHYRLVTLSG
ncbi:MAG TPA: polysaccharide deacetylase family protein [Streptosporangiaceae bacterium]|nr:polysaccharide deacetylase family protein [Streptosporangiaceae bacterium]